MSDRAKLWADWIVSVYRAYNKFISTPIGQYVVTIDGVEVRSYKDLIALCKKLPHEHIVLGRWRAVEDSGIKVFVPSQYMLLLDSEDPKVWLTGGLNPNSFRADTAWLATGKGKDIYGRQYYELMYVPACYTYYDKRDLEDGLMWFADLFEHRGNSIIQQDERDWIDYDLRWINDDANESPDVLMEEEGE